MSLSLSGAALVSSGGGLSLLGASQALLRASAGAASLVAASDVVLHAAGGSLRLESAALELLAGLPRLARLSARVYVRGEEAAAAASLG